jgi:PAS domain S-box-containing protein
MGTSSRTEVDHLHARVEELQRELAQTQKDAANRFAQIVSEAPDPICQFDADLRYVYVNTAYERWTGIPESTLAGKTLAEAGLAPSVARAWTQRLKRALESGVSALHRDEYPAADGIRLYESRFSAGAAGAGEIDRVTVISRDITAQRKTEEELEHTRSRLSSILDSISESFIALGPDWRLTYVNRRATEQTGKNREQLIGRNIWELFPALLETEFKTQFESVMRNRAPVSFQVGFEQTGRQFEAHAYPSGEGIAALIVEVTDRKKLDQERQAAHETIGALVHASPLPIVALAPGGNITVWNQAAERTFGWKAEEVLGKPLPFIPEDKLEEHRDMRAHGLQGLGFAGREIERLRKDGSPIDLSISTAAIRGDDGAVRAVFAIFQDITARKRAERSLRESEHRLREREEALRLATESAEVGIWHYDVAHHRLKLSALAAKLIGLAPQDDEIGVKRFLDRVHEDDRPAVRLNIRDTLEEGNEYSAEYRVMGPHGETRWVAARGLAATGEDGRRTRFSGVISDITERKRVEQELARHAQDLARSNADLQQFAFVTSHDLQEPLRTIGAYAQLLLRRSESRLDADGRVYLGFIVDGATRMQRLINDLLAFSRILHGQERAAKEVDMEAVFGWAVMNLNNAIKETGAAITHDPLPHLPGNEQEIVQLMQNLLGNAIKYHGPEPPRIHLSAEEHDGEIRFTVSDNGIGIDPAYHQQIFGVFKRLHGKDVPGTGIGLALCKRIVEKHGGRIWVDSEVGKGARFCFTLQR